MADKGDEKGKSKADVVLTRAARRKAGLPPPTPLFKGVPHKFTKTEATSTDTTPTALTTHTTTSLSQPPPTHQRARGSRRSSTHSTVAAALSDSSDSSSSSDEEGGEGKPLWVQCEDMSCRKWRRLPHGVELDLSKKWYCKMHPDPTHQSCDIPEEKWKVSRTYTFNKLHPGELIWAKMGGFPPWPALVSPDPWSNNDHISVEREGCLYHVEFLGKSRTHLWIPEEKTEPYHVDSKNCQLKKFKRSKTLEQALTEADEYLSLSMQERLSRCVYREGCVEYVDSTHKNTAKYNPNVGWNVSSHRGSSGSRKPRCATQRTFEVKSEHNSEKTRQTPTMQRQSFQQSHAVHKPALTFGHNSSHFNLEGAPLRHDLSSSHVNLFKTLGIEFSEDDLINSIAQKLQSQLTAALQTQHANTQPTATYPSQSTHPAHVQSQSSQTTYSAPLPLTTLTTPTPQSNASSATSSSAAPNTTLQSCENVIKVIANPVLNSLLNQPSYHKTSQCHTTAHNPTSNHVNNIERIHDQRVPATKNTLATTNSFSTSTPGPKRLTQSSLDIRNRSVSLTTSPSHTRRGRGVVRGSEIQQPRKKRASNSGTARGTTREGQKSLRGSPTGNVGHKRRRERRKKSNSPSQVMSKSPTLTYYFKSTNNSPTSAVQDVNTTSPPPHKVGVATGLVGGAIHNGMSQQVGDQRAPNDLLECEIQSELQEIEDMLSMFEGGPALDVMCTQSPPPSSSAKEVSVNDTQANKSQLSENGVQLSAGTAMGEQGLESVMMEIDNIENLMQDLSKSQVVPY